MVTLGNKGWILVWAGVSVFAVLCVYAAVWNLDLPPRRVPCRLCRNAKPIGPGLGQPDYESSPLSALGPIADSRVGLSGPPRLHSSGGCQQWKEHGEGAP
jgi:hypothetical protein